MAIHGTQFPVRAGPFVPDGNPMLLQPVHVGVARNEPQKLIDDGLEVHFFGGQERETIGQIEAHLVAEHALGARPGAVFFHGSVFPDMLQKV